MKMLLIARKYLLELIRDPQYMLLTILAPAVMMLVMAFGYGRNPRLVTYPILVFDQSGGLAQEDIQQLEAVRYPDGRSIFKLVSDFDIKNVDNIIKEKTAALSVLFYREPSGKLARSVKGDATSMAFINASGYLESVLNPVQERREGLHPILDIKNEPLTLHAPNTEFDSYTPGVMIMSILLLIPQTAMLVGREIRKGTIKRLRISALSTGELFAGISLAQLVAAIIQTALMFIIAILLGFNYQGSLWLSLGICLLLSFSSIGIGLLVACFIHNDSEAVNTGSVFSMMQVFLSGAFFPFSTAAWVTVQGHELNGFDFIPATQAMTILRQSLVCGAPFGEISFRLFLMGVLSIFYFVAGLVIFNLKRDK